MNSIKIHVGNLSDDGTVNCDYRNEDGSERLGAAQGDHHKTIFEIDPASDSDVALVLELGPKLNELFSRFTSPVEGFGVKAGLRIGVWPGDGRK